MASCEFILWVASWFCELQVNLWVVRCGHKLYQLTTHTPICNFLTKLQISTCNLHSNSKVSAWTHRKNLQLASRTCNSQLAKWTCSLKLQVPEVADDQCSSISKCSIYHIKHMLIQPFTMGVDWPEIGCLMASIYVWCLHILCFTLYSR